MAAIVGRLAQSRHGERAGHGGGRDRALRVGTTHGLTKEHTLDAARQRIGLAQRALTTPSSRARSSM